MVADRSGLSGILRSRATWRGLLTLGIVMLLAVAPGRAIAQDTEIMRGTIVGVDRKPVEGVSVTITGLATQKQSVTTTNAKGIYTAIVSPGEGEYIISLRRIGYTPQSLHAMRTGLSPVVVTNATMVEVAQVLDDRTVSANRTVPGASAEGKSIGGNDRDLMAGALFTLDPTDMLALAATVPGVLMIKGGNGLDSSYSVLGMGGDANNLMIDGVTSGSNNLPSLSVNKATVATNTYDINRSGFSGASMMITTRSGNDVFEATATSSMTNQHLTWADKTSVFQQPAQVLGSVGVGGPIIKRKLTYFGAMDIRDARTETFNILNSGPGLLSQYGMTPDTVAALKNVLRNLGIPMTLDVVPDKRLQTSGSGSMRIDFRPKATSMATLSVRGNWSDFGGPNGGSLSFPVSGGKSHNDNVTVQLNGSATAGVFLNEFRGSFTHTSNRSDPYLLAPSGTVRLGTVFADGRTGLTSVRFGSGAGVSGGSSWTASLANDLSVLTSNSKHRIRLSGQVTQEHLERNLITNGLGGYSYQSLSDLAAGRAATYSRTLSTRNTETNGLSGFVGFQDEFLASQKLQFSLGIRSDVGRPGNRPPSNPAIKSLFGYANDFVPTAVGLTPRLGFSWTPTKGNQPKAATPAPNSTMTAAQMEAAMLAGATSVIRTVTASGVTEMRISGPGGLPMVGMGGAGNAKLLTLSGGVGVYRNAIRPQQIASLVDQTGLPSTTRYLNCVGTATPVPVWTGTGDFSPESCVDGTGPIELNNARPNVSLYDPSYRPSSRWSANLGLDGIRVRNWAINVQGSYNLGVNLESSIDMNLRRDPLFTVASESSRPVYVAESNIVPSSGVIAQNAARLNPDYGRVARTVSDLHNRTLQLQLYVTPPKPLFGKVPLNLSYTWVPYARAEQRGLGGGGGGDFFFEGGTFIGGGFGGGNTAGDPFRKEWAGGTQSTHQIGVSTSYRIWWFSLSAQLSLMSGLPYTPMVANDINGDGSANDRAFIFDPATAADPELAAQMQSLLASTTPSARKCLERQFGTIAGRNSCRTPWNTRTDLFVSFTPPRTLGIGDRLKFSAGLVNAGSALIRLTGLKNSFLGQSQVSPYPDARLLHVTGFDPSSKRFIYRVNQLYGLPQDFGAQNSRLSPFQVRLGAEFKMGGPPRAPMATGLGLIPAAKEPPLTKEQIRTRLRGLSTDPVASILKMADSLHLTTAQVGSIQRIGDAFWVQADSIFAPLSEFVAKKGREMTDLELNTQLPKVKIDVQKLMAGAKVKAMGELTPAQKSLLALFSAPPGAAPVKRP